MTEPKGWRAVPPAYVIAFAAWLIALAVTLVTSFQEWGRHSERWSLVGMGAHFAANVLLVAGAFELSRRVAGRARQGLRVAAWLSLGFVLAATIVRWVAAIERSDPEPMLTFYKVWGFVVAATAVATAIAYAVAGWKRRPLAIAGLAMAVIATAGNLFAGKLTQWLGWDVAGYYRVYALVSLVDLAGTIALVLAAASGAAAPSPEPARATLGLSRIAGALYLRIVALCVGTGLVVLFVVGSPRGGDSGEGFIKLAVFSGALIALLSQAYLAVGVIEAAGAAVAELAAWPLAIAAALALWCTGVANTQLPELYETLYGKYGSFSGDTAQQLVAALPLVATVSLAVVAAVIGAFATRRSLEDLRVHASGKGVGFVVLTLAGVAITAWLIPKAETLSSFAVMSLCAIAAMLSGMVLMARLCRLAADAMNAEPGLPSAKLVS